MKHTSVILGLLLTLLILSPASATSLLPISLQQLSTRASLIFYAEVISNETRKDVQSGRIATFTEFKIIDLIKGNAESSHTIKQIGGYDPVSKTRLYIQGVPTFQTGKSYVVFLPSASALGFCSPLGLYQGSFTVTTVDGEQIVSNGRNLTEPVSTNINKILQIPLAINAHKPSQSRLTDFISTVRSHNIQ
jgi:hypothetical protein